jgi:methionyl-tRNA formyltransferase
MQINKIIFMGTPGFALPTLEKLYLEFGSQIKAVFTKPDAIQGRGHKLLSTPIKKYALSKNIPVFEPQNKKEITRIIQKINPDLVIIIAYGMILEKEITDHYFCLNVHASLLPKYRGPSPINSVFLNQETETGITLMQINEKMDEGDILLQQKISINPLDNAGTIHDKLALLGAELTSDYTKNNFAKDNLNPQKQNHQQATYCQKVKAQDLELNLKMSPAKFLARVKAFAPYPGAYILHHEKRIKILDAKITDHKIEILQVKPAGKGLMSYENYCKGNAPLI